MKTITVDAIDYIISTQESPIVREERVYILDVNYVPLATAIVDHNMECIQVDYDDDTESTSYPYFEFTTLEDLAIWTMATSY